MKLRQLITATIILLSITGIRAQDQEVKRPLKDSIWLTDALFVSEVAPRIQKAVKLIQDSSIPTKESLPVLNSLNELVAYLNNQLLEKSKAKK